MQTRILTAAVAIVWMLLPARPVTACINDRDTLAMEIRGLPQVHDIITGRFARQPARYYEMRLARVTQQLKQDPTRLDLYDDAAVACDRLARSDDAIAWMQRKKEQLDKFGPNDAAATEARYRYHANLGTFYAHRWIRNGANRADLSDLQRGRDLIARAIEIKPDAHFGREQYQYMAMQWLVTLPPPRYESVTGITETASILDVVGEEGQVPDGGGGQPFVPEKAVIGLAGLIALGNAWESVDVFYALAIVLRDTDRPSLALLAIKRCDELLRNGRKSLHPNGPTAATFGKFTGRGMMTALDQNELLDYYDTARDNAKTWHANRLAFMTKRLDKGMHPDTDSDFWIGYADTPGAPLPSDPTSAHLMYRFERNPVLYAALGAGILVVCAAVIIAVIRRRDRKARMTEPF